MSAGEIPLAAYAAIEAMNRWPLMESNILREDLAAVVEFLHDEPRLTNGSQVLAFEREFADWLGVKYAVMVNSGSSANLVTMAALKEKVGLGEVIMSPLGWSSDVASLLHVGYKPVFVDIDMETLALDWDAVAKAITPQTKFVFPTHCLGFDACAKGFPKYLPVIEDACEALGATHGVNGPKLGACGFAGNFSFYYAHHMSTIEGGMITTNDEHFYELCRILRSHGLTRECANKEIGKSWQIQGDSTSEDFTFYLPGFNVRPTEINAVIGRSQLKRLGANNAKRTENLNLFLDGLDTRKYLIEYRRAGSCNYALPLILRDPDAELMRRVLEIMDAEGVEYRRGTAGGGNQLRQPYLKKLGLWRAENYPNLEHVHFHGLYLGNYPSLDQRKIASLCQKLNAL